MPPVPGPSPLIPSHCQTSPIRRERSLGAFAGKAGRSECGMRQTIADWERAMKRALLAAGWMAMAVTNAQAQADWPQYGGDQGGQRHSAATQITPANVTKLRQVWSYSTGAMTRHAGSVRASRFENTPILN